MGHRRIAQNAGLLHLDAQYVTHAGNSTNLMGRSHATRQKSPDPDSGDSGSQKNGGLCSSTPIRRIFLIIARTLCGLSQPAAEKPGLAGRIAATVHTWTPGAIAEKSWDQACLAMDSAGEAGRPHRQRAAGAGFARLEGAMGHSSMLSNSARGLPTGWGEPPSDSDLFTHPDKLSTA